MNKKILFLSSTYPFGDGENFIAPEIDTLSSSLVLYVIPTYPRGNIKIDFPKNKNIQYLDLSLLDKKYILPTAKLLIKKPMSFLRLIKRCRSDNVMRFCRNAILIPKAIFLNEFIQEKGIDILYSHWLTAPTQLALLINGINGISYGATGHRWDVVDANNFELKFEYAKFVRLISNKSIELLPPDISSKYKDKIHTVHMGVNIDPRKCPITKSNDNNKNFKVLCIANLIPVKGHVYLIEAMKILHDKGLNVYLDLIGDGNLKQELTEQIKALELTNYVKLLGVFSHSELLNKLRTGEYELYCQPSIDLGNGHHEGIPVSLMEAMGHKVACISTYTGSIPELIENLESGVLVEDKSSSELAIAIERLYTDESLRTLIARNGYLKILKYFNQELNIEKIRALINA